MSRIRRALHDERVVRLRLKIRDVRHRHVDVQLRQLEVIRKRIIRGDVDVLVLGDSSCLFGSPRDPDPAMIPELIGRELGGVRIAHFSGAGYSAPLHAEVLRILGTLDERPRAVVTSVCVRTSMMKQVVANPQYNYRTTLEAMAGIRSARHRIRSLGRGYEPSPEEYAGYETEPVRTHWSGETTLGDLRSKLVGQGPPPWPPEVEATRFDFFHGEVLDADHPRLELWREFGRQAVSYGVPVVSYQTAESEERGELHYPGEFTSVMKANRALVAAAIRETAGADHPILDPGLHDEDFADSRDGSEHWALSGRLKVARGVAGLLDAHPGWSRHR